MHTKYNFIIYCVLIYEFIFTVFTINNLTVLRFIFMPYITTVQYIPQEKRCLDNMFIYKYEKLLKPFQFSYRYPNDS